MDAFSLILDFENTIKLNNYPYLMPSLHLACDELMVPVEFQAMSIWSQAAAI